MHRPKLVLAWGALVAALFGGCVNLNVYVYFDQKKLDDAADRFVLDVRREVLKDAPAAEPQPSGTPPASEQPKKGSSLRLSDAHEMFASIAFVQEASAGDEKYINTDTPAIRKIKDRMRERMKKLVRFFDAGNIGESNAAALDIRSSDGISVKDKGELRSLVKEENADREELFREVQAANNAAESEMEKIRKAWAKAFRERTNDGWWIQKDDGDWVRKGSEEDR